MIDQNTKNQAYHMLKDAYERRQSMGKYTNKAIAKRYGVGLCGVSLMRKGEHVNNGLDDKQRTRVRMDFMRHDDLMKGYKSLDQIAADLGVSRTRVRRWSAEFGFTGTKPEPKAKVKRSVIAEEERPETAVDRFLTMQLTSNPCGLARYY